MNLTRGATRIDTKKYPLLILNLRIPGVFPSLLLISNALSVADAFSLTDFPKKPSLRLSLYQKFLFCQQYFLHSAVFKEEFFCALLIITASNDKPCSAASAGGKFHWGRSTGPAAAR